MRRTLYLLGAVLALVALVAAGCGDDDEGIAETGGGSTTSSSAGIPDGPEIKVGAQDFGESKILAEIYAQALDAEGYTASVEELGGFRDLLIGAFEGGDVNFSAEYAASMLEFLNDKKGEATADAAETVGLLNGYLEEKDLVALEPAPGVDSNAFVMTSARADELGVTKISDLAGKESGLEFGAPQDCETNPNCLPGLKETYGVDLSGGFVALEAGPVTAAALEEGEIDIAVLFSTAGVIAEKGFVVLEDDKGLIAADNITPVVATDVVDAYGDDFETFVNSISEKLTTEGLTELNKRFEIDKEDASAIAEDWLTENGFL